MKFLNIVRHDCGPRYDANETAAFARELEYLHAEVIEAKYPDLKWRNVMPVKTGAPLGATAHRWFEIDGFGEAKFLDNMATGDFPTAEVKGTEQTEKIRSIGAKWMVTVEELRAAQMMRIKPESEKAKLARRAVESLIDKAVFGHRSQTFGGFKGLLHDNNSTAYTPHATQGSNGTWSSSGAITDPVKLVHDVRGAIDAAFLETKGAFQQYDLFLSPEAGVLLDQPMYFVLASSSDKQFINMSIKQFMLANIARLRSISVDNFRMTNAGTGGNTQRCLVYPRDPEVLDAFLPLDYEQFAPQLSGMAFVTHAHAKYGGLRIKHPKAIRRFDVTAT